MNTSIDSLKAVENFILFSMKILVIGGGVIPDADIPGLKAAGVAEVFTPGTPTGSIVEFIKANAK